LDAMPGGDVAASGLSVQAGKLLQPLDRPERWRWRDASRVLLVSALLLVPCFWQSRIQAGDLSSHLYNAWLATLITEGKAPGLWIEHRSNNILSDVALQWLFQHAGPGAAQRILVSASVLVFGWGAIAFIFVLAGRKNWWLVLPCVWILAYGFAYEIGFFNFYLSFGICLWYLTIFWRRGWRIGLAASPLLILAWITHPFPAVWALGTVAYLAVARNRPLRQVRIILCVCAVVLWAARQILMSDFECRWFWQQILLVSGADQALIFGLKYLYIVAPVLLVSILLIIRQVKSYGKKNLALTMPFQLWVLNATAVVLLPNDIFFPQYAVAFGYVANRLSLPAGIMACALLAQVPLRIYEKTAMVGILAAFSFMLYQDTRKLNRWEDSVDAQVAQLPFGQRVINALPVLSLPVDPLSHMVDRACVGRCYSYANYEPSTRQFRIRAGKGNAIVLSEYADVFAIEKNGYTMQPRDIPSYLMYACRTTQWGACIRPLSAGETVFRGMGATSPTRSTTDTAPPMTTAGPKPNEQRDHPARRKVAAEGVHRRFGGDIYATVDENYEGGPALVVHNRKATEEWAKNFFTEGVNSPTNELWWLLGFRSYLVTNGNDSWQMEIEEDPKYRSLFKDQPAPVKP
jgi:hypothetical protein